MCLIATGHTQGPVDTGRQEEQSVLDRELKELLSEIRVVLPGVTVLFAFLLTVPFTTVFASTPHQDRDAYFIAFISSALAMIFLIAQSSYHQLRGKPYDKALMLHTAKRQAVTAIALLAISMTAAVFMVADVVYPGRVAIPVTATVFSFAVILWFVLPLGRRLRRDR